MKSSSEPAALAADRLIRTFGGRRVIDNASFSIEAGEIVGLVGLNGAGKTTIVNMILGVLIPTSGAISINGIDLADERERALTHTNFSAVYAPLPGNLTVSENLRVFGMLYNVPKLAARINEVLESLDLVRFRRTRCGLLSSGEQSRVSLAKALLNRPRLLVLDEPTASMDPATAEEIRRHIRDYVARDHGAVLWTSHNMYEVEQVCDRMLLLSTGRILLEGDPRALPAAHGKASLQDLFIEVARDAAR